MQRTNNANSTFPEHLIVTARHIIHHLISSDTVRRQIKSLYELQRAVAIVCYDNPMIIGSFNPNCESQLVLQAYISGVRNNVFVQDPTRTCGCTWRLSAQQQLPAGCCPQLRLRVQQLENNYNMIHDQTAITLVKSILSSSTIPNDLIAKLAILDKQPSKTPTASQKTVYANIMSSRDQTRIIKPSMIINNTTIAH